MSRDEWTPPSAGRAAMGGFAWLMLLSLGSRIMGLLTQVALSRLLSPHDFGEIGLAYTVTGFVNALTLFGIEEVLVQRQRALRHWSGTALAINLVLAGLGALVVIAVAPLAAQVYRTPELVGLLSVSALALLLSPLPMLPRARIRATMRFRLLTALSAAEVIATSLLIVLFAWMSFGAYSFVLPLPIVAAAKAAVFWATAPVRLTRPRLTRAPFLFKKASVVFSFRLVVTAVGQGDYLILGLTADPVQVGLYYFAFRLALQPVTILAGNISGVLFPLLVRHRRQPEQQQRILLTALRTVNLAIMPICMLQAALSPLLVPPIFGAKWIPAVPMVVILTLGTSVDAAAWQIGALLNSRGEFGRTFRYTAALAPLFFVFTAIGAVTHGALGVSVAVAAYYLLSCASFTWLALRHSGVTLGEMALLYLQPALLAGASGGLGMAAGAAPPFAGSVWAQVAIICLVTLLVFVCGLSLWYPREFAFAVNFLRERLGQAISRA